MIKTPRLRLCAKPTSKQVDLLALEAVTVGIPKCNRSQSHLAMPTQTTSVVVPCPPTSTPLRARIFSPFCFIVG